MKKQSGLEKFEAEFVQPATGFTLITGSRIYGSKEDRRKRFTQCIGIDMQEGDGVDFVVNMEGRIPEDWEEKFSHAECTSVLEHCERPWLAALFIEEALKPGGTLFVSIPWTWRLHGYPEDNFRVSPNGLLSLFPAIDWKARSLVTQREILPETLAKFPSCVDGNGDKFLQRTETCGFGVRR